MLLSVATGVIYCRSWGPRKLGWDFVTSAPSDGLNAWVSDYVMCVFSEGFRRALSPTFKKGGYCQDGCPSLCRASEGGRISCPVEMFRQYLAEHPE